MRRDTFMAAVLAALIAAVGFAAFTAQNESNLLRTTVRDSCERANILRVVIVRNLSTVLRNSEGEGGSAYTPAARQFAENLADLRTGPYTSFDGSIDCEAAVP